MRVPTLGQASCDLPWLSPCTASLLALARLPAAAAWAEIRFDPGAVLLVVRQSTAALSAPNVAAFPLLLDNPALLDGAMRRWMGTPSTGCQFMN